MGRGERRTGAGRKAQGGGEAMGERACLNTTTYPSPLGTIPPRRTYTLRHVTINPRNHPGSWSVAKPGMRLGEKAERDGRGGRRVSRTKHRIRRFHVPATSNLLVANGALGTVKPRRTRPVASSGACVRRAAVPPRGTRPPDTISTKVTRVTWHGVCPKQRGVPAGGVFPTKGDDGSAGTLGTIHARVPARVLRGRLGALRTEIPRGARPRTQPGPDFLDVTKPSGGAQRTVPIRAERPSGARPRRKPMLRGAR